jgi:hypothetical protein
VDKKFIGMNIRNSKYCFVNLILAVFFVFQGCQPKNKKAETIQQKESVQPVKQNKGSLFDGKTLDGWAITDYGTQGPVMVTDGKIILNFGDGCTGINWLGDFPKMNYEIMLEARKTLGNDFFCGITFPVNDEFCSLIVGGWGGPVVGLSCIDGEDAAHNETQILKKFEKEVWYKVRLKVDSERISAWIDNEKLVDFEYPGHKLSLRAEVGLSKPFGLFTWETTGEIRNLKLEISE